MRWICRHHARVAAFLSMSDGTGKICGWAALVDARVDGWIVGLSAGVRDNSGGAGPGEEPAVGLGLPVEGSDGFSGGVLAVCLPSF